MKNFDKWNNIKKKTENNLRPEYCERDIWMTSLGENIGVEQGGKGDLFLRPVLVFKKFNKDFFIGIPLSTTTKNGIFYCKLMINFKFSNALLSQIRVLDAKRFKYKMNRINNMYFNKIKQKTRNMIF